jgi:alpha-aminoadipic semialdehyde synthase
LWQYFEDGLPHAQPAGARFHEMSKIGLRGTLLATPFGKLPIMRGVELQGVANRDSLPYAQTYGFGTHEDLRTCLRGTLR